MQNAQARALRKALIVVSDRVFEQYKGGRFDENVSHWIGAMKRFEHVYVYAMHAKRRYWEEHRILYGYGKAPKLGKMKGA